MEKITGCKGRALQVRKPRSDQQELTAKECRAFFDHLAATCNVQPSATAAGRTATKVFYRRRRVDEMFAAAWRDAMWIGYDRLEEALLARALAQVGGSGDDGEVVEANPDAVSIELADGGTSVEGVADRSGLRLAAGMATRVARVDVQLALALLNRQAAIARQSPERRRGRVTVEEVEAVVAAKLDRLADQLARQQLLVPPQA